MVVALSCFMASVLREHGHVAMAKQPPVAAAIMQPTQYPLMSNIMDAFPSQLRWSKLVSYVP
ncbi:hypothetical protein C7E12_01920 [Stenotrophomonas maltophilia]|nr:hypothetical protein C7E12_01920 [Stenotrophomonas maltophilia]